MASRAVDEHSGEFKSEDESLGNADPISGDSKETSSERMAYDMEKIGVMSEMQVKCNGRILSFLILSYRACLSYLITAPVLSFSFIYGCGLVK